MAIDPDAKVVIDNLSARLEIIDRRLTAMEKPPPDLDPDPEPNPEPLYCTIDHPLPGEVFNGPITGKANSHVHLTVGKNDPDLLVEEWWLQDDGSFGPWVFHSTEPNLNTIWSFDVDLPDGRFFVNAWSVDGNRESEKIRVYFSVNNAPIPSPPPPPPPPLPPPPLPPPPLPPSPDPSPTGTFAFQADGTLIDPEGKPFLPRGVNGAAGTHTKPGYFKGANLNNKNYDFLQLNGWLAPAAAASKNVPSYVDHIDVLRSAWQFNTVRLNVDGSDNVQWGSDAELWRVIKSLTDQKVVAMVEQHSGVTGKDPSQAWITENEYQIGVLAEWAAENLENPNYFWYNPWNEPSGASGSTYRGKKAYESDAWVQWHVGPTKAYLEHLPGGIVVWDDVHVGQGRVWDESFDAANSCVLTHGRSVRYGGANHGVPVEGFSQVMFSVHMYQKWARLKGSPVSPSIVNGLVNIPQYIAVARDKKLPIMNGELGGRNDEAPAYLRGDQEAAHAFCQLRTNGVGALWWGASVRYESGFMPGTRPVTTHQNTGISRVPFWFYDRMGPITYTGPVTGHKATTEVTLTGREFWNWCNDDSITASPGWLI